MRFILAVALLVAQGVAMAETGYVTDRLRLGLHNAEDTSDTPFRYLESGDSFEILSRNGYYGQVQLPDGTTGYVKLGYVVIEPPAALVVAQTRAENERLATELAETRASFEDPAARIDELRASVATLAADLESQTARANDLANENESLVARQAAYAYSLPYRWVAGAILVCLIGGILLGVWWVDRQNRRRHGGIRVL